MTVRLPDEHGGWRQVEVREPRPWTHHPAAFDSRVAFAAAHVVADARGDNVPGASPAVDWDATLEFRRHLFRYGMGVAEAMDTAQRNMGVDWPTARELIVRSAAQANASGARIASGAGTDHRPDATGLQDVIDAYAEQIDAVEDAGSQVILMASRQLAAAAAGPADYRKVYDGIVRRATEPVILHWLGEMFDPHLEGYWGSTDVDEATDHFVALVDDHADHIDGVKVSLLSADHERGLRQRLPSGVRLYTGDDFNYPELIRGDGTHHSDALLGAFAAIAPAAAAALSALDHGDVEGYDREMGATLELSRHLFATPTFNYKTGIAFLSWLSGHQAGFTMIAGMQSARSALHLSRVFELANEAQLLPDPDLAVDRLHSYLDVAGIVA